jgi:hypothetical protein
MPLPKSSFSTSSSQKLEALFPCAALLLTLFRFLSNANSLSALYFYDDEWYTLLAGAEILAHGIPLFPSGLVYDHGILYSYLEALMFLVTGFNEVLGRWPSLWISTLTLPVAYSVTRRISYSSLASLVVVGMLVLDPVAIEWGAKARMTAMAQLWVWPLLYIGWQIGKNWRKQRIRRLFYGLAILGVLTHLIVSFQVISVGLATVIFIFLQTKRRFLHQFQSFSWVDAAGLLLIGSLVFWLSQIGFMSKPIEMGLAGGINPGVGLGRLALIFRWFVSRSDLVIARLILFPGILGYILLLLRFAKDGASTRWRAILYLGTDFAVTSGLFFFVAAPRRWHTNYASTVLLPPFAMLMAIGIEGLIKESYRTLIGRTSSIGRIRDRAIAGEAAVFFLLFFLAMNSMRGTVFRYIDSSVPHIGYPPGHPYQQAYEHIRANWQENDKLMTIYAATCELYFDECDLYPNQTYPAVFERDAKSVDVWAGGLWLASVDDIKRELEASGKLWFVGDTGKSFDAASLEYGMTHMEPVFQSAYVAVWRER